MIDSNIQLYKKIFEDEAFGNMFFDLLFDHVQDDLEKD
jgi:hypothetical protein